MPGRLLPVAILLVSLCVAPAQAGPTAAVALAAGMDDACSRVAVRGAPCADGAGGFLATPLRCPQLPRTAPASIACGGHLPPTREVPCGDALVPPVLRRATWTKEGVQLEWSPPAVGDPTGYYVYRVPGHPQQQGVSLRPIAMASGEATSYLDQTVSPDVTYTYWLASTAGACTSGPSNVRTSGSAMPEPPIIPDTADCVSLGLNPGSMPPVKPHVYGLNCLLLSP